ncbi:MAG: hypothetical protein E3J30_01400 [Anaerolineales bacterium]|nr:MAG: hypothetical protein E3J30_01400 [Anaerolineales bacterium]
MKQYPAFLKAFTEVDAKKTYRLITLNRSGERVAWLLVLTLVILDAALLSRLGSISLTALIFTILFLLAALASSFSNWLDRNTKITVSESDLVHQTPIRRVAMMWRDVDSLRLTRRGAGWYVMVVGDQRVFTFQTPTSIKGPIGREARTGIENGEQLAAIIARQADLVELELEGDVWVCRRERSAKSE